MPPGERCQRRNLSHLVENRLHHLIKNDTLTRGRREHPIEIIRLITQRIRPHQKLHKLSLHPLRLQNDVAVLPHLPLVPAPTPHEHVDARLVAATSFGLVAPLLSLRARGVRRGGHDGICRRNGPRAVENSRAGVSRCRYARGS